MKYLGMPLGSLYKARAMWNPYRKVRIDLQTTLALWLRKVEKCDCGMIYGMGTMFLKSCIQICFLL
jgi:hypothetical protein